MTAGPESPRRIRRGPVALVVVTTFGAVGHLLLGFTFLRARCQTVTTVNMVGYRTCDR